MKVDILYRYEEGDDTFSKDVAQVVIAIDEQHLITYEHNDYPMVKSAAFIDGMRAAVFLLAPLAPHLANTVDVQLYYKADYPT
jgi:hypothetical protein